MAGIFELGSQSGLTAYAVIHDNTGNVWNGATFVVFNSVNWATYAMSFTEQAGSGYYKGTFPTVTAGKYTIVAYRQYGGTPDITDAGPGPIAMGAVFWAGTKEEQGVGLVLVDNKLDLLALTPGGNPVIGTLVDKIMNKNSGQTFSQTTDSLEAQTDAGGSGPSAATIAAAVWDEQITGVLHITTDSAGQRLKAIGDKLPVTGTISNFDKTVDNVLLAANQSGVTIGTVNALGTQAKADVKQQAQDSLGVDTLAELTVGVPPALPTIKQALMLAYMALRNKRIATAAVEKIYNSAGSAIAAATLSDDGVTTTKEQFVAGP